MHIQSQVRLATLSDALLANAAVLGDRAVGVVVVDDSSDGKACSVIERYVGRFELGVEYRRFGRQIACPQSGDRDGK
jgi:hypothetical protein